MRRLRRRTALVAAAAMIPILWTDGCGTHALLVEPGTPVRLAEPVEARVYVPDGAGRWVQGSAPVRVPAGWYALPPPQAPPAHPAPQRSTIPATRPAS